MLVITKLMESSNTRWRLITENTSNGALLGEVSDPSY